MKVAKFPCVVVLYSCIGRFIYGSENDVNKKGVIEDDKSRNYERDAMGA